MLQQRPIIYHNVLVVVGNYSVGNNFIIIFIMARVKKSSSSTVSRSLKLKAIDVAKYSATSVVPASVLAQIIKYLFPNIPDELLGAVVIVLTYVLNLIVYTLEKDK